MGAWELGHFGNDDALDWIGDLEASGQPAIDEALGCATDSAADYIEEPECCVTLAAAEVVAALLGKPATDLPDGVRAWVAGKASPDEQLVSRALAATEAVLSESELKDLWQESDHFEKWAESVKNLQARLT